MDSQDLARYIEATDGHAKPWLLAQLRLLKLQEERDRLSPDEYADAIADLHAAVMNLGEWWVGREDEVF
ncbi:MAG TPA: hypothetical protein IGS37_14390 [Synechococcales cyanobacterium M55_K2018_004]|nr:hypothetical protein [Synechococcales cyanobacterium M55_K2018_004]